MSTDDPTPTRPDDDAAAGSPLVGATFRVTAIEGVPTLAEPTAELTFGEDGRLSGRATVNRIMGPYTLVGDALTFGALAATMMAGPPEAMDQEQRLHQALGRCTRVVTGGVDGEVVLAGDDGTALVALEYADILL
jgi:heat shock protein HslJ